MTGRSGILRKGQRCGAKRKNGPPGFCLRWPLAGKRRCRAHGGAGGAPHHPGGLQPIALARVRAKQELYRALGLPWFGGQPRTKKRVLSMVEQAKVSVGQAIVELEAALPADVRAMPLEELTAPQALARASLVGLQQLVRIVEQPLDFDNLKQVRLIGDMALGANKLFQKHGSDGRKMDLIGQLLAVLEMEKQPTDGTK